MMLSPIEAEKELLLGGNLNQGLWVKHSMSVGQNARLIAEKIDCLNDDTAYVMGLMHDIGRREGQKGNMHIFDGYNYMMELHQAEIAKICLTHSYPIKDVDTFFGKSDCTSEQKVFLANYLKRIEYDEYDRLIQLCDAISLPNGACIIEKRFVDVALRHGLPKFTIDKWKAYLELKNYYDKLCGCNIYTLLLDVAENSYDNLL